MQLENIEIEFIEGSEKQDSRIAEIHYIDAVNLETLGECPECRYPMVPKTKNYRPIFHYCEGPDGVKRIYNINLCSQRYECTNPETVHSVTAGMLKHKSPFSAEFKKYVIELFLENAKCSYNGMAKRLGLSQPAVSQLVKDFARGLNIQFDLKRSFMKYYFHGFHYMGRYRYYLTGFDFGSQPELIAFFGFEDAWDEIEAYIGRCWDINKRYYEIYTDDDKRLQITIRQIIGNKSFSVSRYVHDKRISSFLQKYEGTAYSGLLENEIEKFRKMLLDGSSEKNIQEWFDSFGVKEKNIRSALEEFRAELGSSGFYTFEYSGMTDHTEFDRKIDFYKAQKLPFDIMVVKMMYSQHDRSIFGEETSEKDTDDFEWLLLPEEKIAKFSI
ncbi:MAG: hypothetical protein MJ117_00480 [Lachnospiraceae bacterium]|nr:hypothetical protein [Lachnospiraceae bacterium]